MVEKAKIFYFSVFIFVVIAFIFHVTAMGYHHWKKAEARNITFANTYNITLTTIGLFTRCTVDPNYKMETCFPNLFPNNQACSIMNDCLARQTNTNCSCDFLPSTKGIAACSIIAAIFLGLAIIILFIHSINTSETRTVSLLLGLLPLILLLLSFIFILITLILVGSYLSRDIMEIIYQSLPVTTSFDVGALRTAASTAFQIRVDWSTGLEIISLILTFFSLILYSAYVFKFGRSLNINTGKSPVIHSSIILDKKYENIRTEAIHAGILLKETDEKIDEIIHDGDIIKSHAYDIRSNALKFYQNIIQSKKLIRYCQLIFILILIIFVIILLGKFFIRKKNQ